MFSIVLTSCPLAGIIYGITDKKYQVPVYKIAGGSSSGGIPDWRRLELAEASNFVLTEQYFSGP
jgi:hypothetical protein